VPCGERGDGERTVEQVPVDVGLDRGQLRRTDAPVAGRRGARAGGLEAERDQFGDVWAATASASGAEESTAPDTTVCR
jgi:hypothetical protein